ncbi:MAG: ABC transporter permease [bacterium]
MDEWRAQLRAVVAAWDVSPEEQAAIVDELEQHLEQELAELSPRIGSSAAHDRIMSQISDPALRDASVRARHRPAASVVASRARAFGWAGIARDFRYGWRSLLGNPGTTAMAIIALALGIGLTTVMFTIIYGTLLRGLPFDEGDRIAVIMEANPSQGEPELQLSTHDFFAYRDAQSSFETFGAFTPITVNVSGTERPERVDGARVTAAALSVTRARPALGRAFRADDEMPGSELVVILSYPLWRDRYANDSSVVGRAIRVDGQEAMVIGVMPEGFAFPSSSRLWLPLHLDPSALPWGAGTNVSGVGRLKPRMTYAHARAELSHIAMRIEKDHPQANKGVRVVVQPFVRAVLRTQIYALLYAMFAAVGLVFLVACTNVANLLLARAASRAKEVAVRAALGASRTAIARQFLVEALILSLLAAGLGALVAQAGIAAFRAATVDVEFPFWCDFHLHPQVLLFVAFAALLASLVSGVLPAITAARSDLTEVLKDQSLGSSSHRSGRLSRTLVVFELTLSSALLVGAALTTKSMLNLRSVEPGFRSRDMMTGRITLSNGDSSSQAAFFNRLDEQVVRLFGATATSITSRLPGTGWNERRVAVAGRSYARAYDQPLVGHLAVSPGFFKAFEVRMLRGRPITIQDRMGAPRVAVVSQRFSEQVLPGMDPIGLRISLNARDSMPTWVTIVGVMPTLYASSPGLDPWPAEVITAFHQEQHNSASVAIATRGDGAFVAQSLRSLVASLDRDLPVYSLRSMSESLSQATWPLRVFGGLFVAFGIVALVMASIGLYAVMAFSTSRREREMGIRMALGAAGADVVRLVLRDAAVQLVVGVSLGVVLGVVAAHLGRAALYRVQPTDPAAIAVVVATLAAAGMAACIVPALRATRADPTRSLRAE